MARHIKTENPDWLLTMCVELFQFLKSYKTLLIIIGIGLLVIPNLAIAQSSSPEESFLNELVSTEKDEKSQGSDSDSDANSDVSSGRPKNSHDASSDKDANSEIQDTMALKSDSNTDAPSDIKNSGIKNSGIKNKENIIKEAKDEAVDDGYYTDDEPFDIDPPKVRIPAKKRLELTEAYPAKGLSIISLSVTFPLGGKLQIGRTKWENFQFCFLNIIATVYTKDLKGLYVGGGIGGIGYKLAFGRLRNHEVGGFIYPLSFGKLEYDYNTTYNFIHMNLYYRLYLRNWFIELGAESPLLWIMGDKDLYKGRPPIFIYLGGGVDLRME